MKKTEPRRLANPLHLANCKNRVLVTKNKKKYTRKEKHKNKMHD